MKVESDNGMNARKKKIFFDISGFSARLVYDLAIFANYVHMKLALPRTTQLYQRVRKQCTSLRKIHKDGPLKRRREKKSRRI